jgi:hypothetical protein
MVILDSEELEIIVRAIDNARKVHKFCSYCQQFFDHAKHEHEASRTNFYLCERCDRPN